MAETWMHELWFSGPSATDEDGPYDAVIEHAVSLGFNFEGGRSAREDVFKYDSERIEELEAEYASLRAERDRLRKPYLAYTAERRVMELEAENERLRNFAFGDSGVSPPEPSRGQQ